MGGWRAWVALRKNGFDAEYAAGREQACERALRFIKVRASVGFGGSTKFEQDPEFHAQIAGRGGCVIEFPGTHVPVGILGRILGSPGV